MKLKLAMIGGGQGAFIGAIHRIASRIDDHYELVAGAFSSNAEKSRASGLALGVSPDRAYTSYQELIEKEKQLPEDERVQVISIVTPNHVHFEPTKLALENGFHVILDKPMTFSLDEAKELEKVVKSSGKLFCLTHTYTGYPMVKEAKQLIASGKIGKVRKVYVEYPQGWLSTFLEGEDNKQASWRTDPGKSGIAGAMGDIGTHAFNLAEYVSGLQTTKLNADINVVVEGRKLDDDGAVLLKYDNGASGVLMATQIAAGDENNVKIRVYGETGGIEWQQDIANTLLVKYLDKPTEIWRTGGGYTSSFVTGNMRAPAGHPEGYLEAFANLYKNFALTVKASIEGKEAEAVWLDFPGVEEGVRGMAFVENVIASGKSDKKWTDFVI
ncbi:Gfo/Idh/MocA family oxidoreductase [Mucilaginibacter roseus]|uniref:Gfo/Idh/MocA family oxidoreductase n=1 Tax=Mucilaginibacter roseus TaxID=1528868 RepID=A0ABS8U1V2_9SPHI|nr:Gfo/Idh/MocA family oxidoreductase [Mucilaginibacter roseus]MCD8740028.1 Gfo/Idh/MocA family oxidoreductase [Mucilaginibacter roseus]